jgi:hypothetical protein
MQGICSLFWLASVGLLRSRALAGPLWGAPKIHGELLKLCIEIGQTSVARYMAWRRSLYWRLAKAQLLRISHPRFCTCSLPQNAPREAGGGIFESGAKWRIRSAVSHAQRAWRESAQQELTSCIGRDCIVSFPRSQLGLTYILDRGGSPSQTRSGSSGQCINCGRADPWHTARAAAEFAPGRP